MDDDVKDDKERTSQLVERSVDGDVHSREQLARWCLPRVRKTIMMAYGHGPELDDLTQIAMTKVFSRIDTFKGSAGFYVWVDRVAINTVRDYYRSRWVWFSRPDENIEHKYAADPLGNPEDGMHRSELMELISAAFGKLKPKLRVAVVLSVLHEYSSSEIAVILDISFASARKRVERGRRLLMEQLSRDPVCREALRELGR